MSATEERRARSVALEQAYVHDVYEQFSEGPCPGAVWPRVSQFLTDLEPGSLVCDVGCGNGKYLSINSSLYNIGVDTSTRLTKLAKDKKNEVLISDNLTLPFRDESFDAVISVSVVHHLATTERRVRAIKELTRILRIGGRIIITVWAMEQANRRFESQDVLVPCPRTNSEKSSAYAEEEEDEDAATAAEAAEDTALLLPLYNDCNMAYNSCGTRSETEPNRKRKKVHSPTQSLSSPNETCYSFVRKALQKLAGGRRNNSASGAASTHHRPWFLDSWHSCTNKHQQHRLGCQANEDGCDEDVQDLPIELRRVDNDIIDGERNVQQKAKLPTTQQQSTVSNVKSKSLTDIKMMYHSDQMVHRSVSIVLSNQNSSLEDNTGNETPSAPPSRLGKPKLVKQKKSVCDEDEDEDLDKPTDMRVLVSAMPDFDLANSQYGKKGVFKQRSLNEELMSTERLREKEKVRQNIQKQASLNEDLMYRQRHHKLDSLRDSLFSVSTSKRFQIIKTNFTNKFKHSTNIDKVTGSSLKNGFVRMFQGWKSAEAATSDCTTLTTVKPEEPTEKTTERRHSREDGSDSSKDSSLQSDTSVDSEDSFASVIYVPKHDPLSPAPISPGPTSPRLKQNTTMARNKQSSCPTSPRIKQPLTIYPAKPAFSMFAQQPADTPPEASCPPKVDTETNSLIAALAELYRTSARDASPSSGPEAEPSAEKKRNDRLKQIRELLNQRPGFGLRSTSSTKPTSFPIVRQASSNGESQSAVKHLPRMMSLELFNPEVDDKDSDSSGVSSPDSVNSVLSVGEVDKKESKEPPCMEEIKETVEVPPVIELELAETTTAAPEPAENVGKADLKQPKETVEDQSVNADGKLQSEQSFESTTDTFDMSEKTTATTASNNSDTNSVSRYSGDCGSTASLGSCPEWTQILDRSALPTAARRPSPAAVVGGNTMTATTASLNASLSDDASQDSLPSDNVGGAITLHRYYHVFREGELDQLIERYVENLHIISSYYDHASWCVVAEKVHVWTI